MRQIAWTTDRSPNRSVRFGATSVQKASIDYLADGTSLVGNWSWHGHDNSLRDYELGPLSAASILPPGSILSANGSWTRTGLLLVRPLLVKQNYVYQPKRICISHILPERNHLRPTGLIARNWVFSAEDWPDFGAKTLRQMSERLGGKPQPIKNLDQDAIDWAVRGGAPFVADAAKLTNTACAFEVMASCLERTPTPLRVWQSLAAGFDEAHASAQIQFVDGANLDKATTASKPTLEKQLNPVCMSAPVGTRAARVWSIRDLSFGLTTRDAVAKACGLSEAAPLVSDALIDDCVEALSGGPFMSCFRVLEWTEDPVRRQSLRYVYAKRRPLRAAVENSLIIASAEAANPSQDLSRLARLALPETAAKALAGTHFNASTQKIRLALLTLLKSPDVLGSQHSLRVLTLLLNWIKSQIPIRNQELLIEQLLYARHGRWKEQDPRTIIPTTIRS